MIDDIAGRLARLPGVLAVTLGGSRAQGTHGPDSDWDLGLYYRGSIDVDGVRALGYAGYVSDPGEWAPFVYGGAWLTVDGQRVDVLYRNLDVVERYTTMASEGRFELARTPGYVVGMPSYVLAGELALGRVLHGELPRPDFPDPLRQRAPERWDGEAAFALYHASACARRGDVGGALGFGGQALVAASHGRLCARAEWALNDKGIIGRAQLGEAAAAFAGGAGSVQAVEQLRAALGVSWPPFGGAA